MATILAGTDAREGESNIDNEKVDVENKPIDESASTAGQGTAQSGNQNSQP